MFRDLYKMHVFKKILLSICSLFYAAEVFANNADDSLFTAIKNNNMTAFKQALSKTNNINAVDSSGKTSILVATNLNNAEMVGLLLEHNANPNILEGLAELHKPVELTAA